MKFSALALLLALAGCETLPAAGTDTMELRTIASGAYAAAAPDEPEAVVARDAESYRNAWKTMIGEGDPPPVDFTREAAVILLAGMRPTGGYSVEPSEVALEGETLVVSASVRGPAGGDLVTQALTSPWSVIAVSDRSFRTARWRR